jgi:hypothetical protein
MYWARATLLLSFDPGVLGLASFAGQRMPGPPPDGVVRVLQQSPRGLRGPDIAVHVEELTAAAANVGVETS